jgi:hypothetical protein
MLSQREVATLTASLSRLQVEAGRVLGLLVTFTESPVSAMSATVNTSALCEAVANLDEDLVLYAGEDHLDLGRPFPRRAIGAA